MRKKLSNSGLTAVSRMVASLWPSRRYPGVPTWCYKWWTSGWRPTANCRPAIGSPILRVATRVMVILIKSNAYMSWLGCHLENCTIFELLASSVAWHDNSKGLAMSKMCKLVARYLKPATSHSVRVLHCATVIFSLKVPIPWPSAHLCVSLLLLFSLWGFCISVCPHLFCCVHLAKYSGVRSSCSIKTSCAEQHVHTSPMHTCHLCSLAFNLPVWPCHKFSFYA